MEKLRDAIFQRSAGIFLWVSLVVSQLNDVFDNDGRMDAIWERLEEIPRAAKEIPVFLGDRPLYGLFKDIVMKDTRNIPGLVRLTQLIFCARRLLRPQEAFVALHRSYHEPFDSKKVKPDVLSKQIRAISKGLAEVTSAEEPTVQFIHETVREFLRDGGLSIISEQSMHGDGHEVLKISCLDQINALDSVAEHFELLADYRTWTRYRNKQDKSITFSQRERFQEQVDQLFPFLEYATHHVLSHANAAAAQGVTQRPFLDSFPSHLWVPLHNLFEEANTKRFSGSETPISYIVAGHGLNSLVRLLMDKGHYATVYPNEQCQTALHNAIYSRHLDTAWVLVGLDPKDRSPMHYKPKLNLSGCRKTLLRALLDAGDADILRKVIRDLGVAYLQQDAAWAQGKTGRDLILNECKSAVMIDCLTEHSMLPNIGPAEENAQNDADRDGSVSPTSDLFFIRRAIDKHPQLLTDIAWGGQCMLDYAFKNRLLPLFALYCELMNSRGMATPNDYMERAAKDGWLDAVKEALSCGADLDYQDESGRTALHKMFAGNCFRRATNEKKEDMCSVLHYLLFKNPKLGASVDRDGYTALDHIRNDLWSCEHPITGDRGYKKALEIFVNAGAVTKIGFICKGHEFPRVAVPWISVELFMQLTGEKYSAQRNLDARDSLGRTPLLLCSRYPRDNSGRTILEHLVRHPRPHQALGKLTVALLKSSALDVNLETSNRHSPLDLIISLYGTWPPELGDTDAEWVVEGQRLKGMDMKLWLSDVLLKTARLLLATKKVDLSEQKRCLAKAPDALRGLILESIKEVEPDYHWKTVNNRSQ